MTQSSRKQSGDSDQDREDRQREWQYDLVSEVWQSRLRLYRELIDRVATVRYPSPSMLDMIERGIPPDLYKEYLAALVDKVFDAKYPSPAMLARLERLTAVAGPLG